ncbi:MAG: hypothetical protein QXD41_03340 [Nitrososphaeria archaeon]
MIIRPEDVNEYSLPRISQPQILFPYVSRGRTLAFLNEAKVSAPDMFYCIICNEPWILISYINSSAFRLAEELISEQYNGVQVVDLEAIPVFYPVKITLSQKQLLTQRFLALSSSVESRIKAEETLESLKSTKKGLLGILELEARKMLEEAIEAERKAQRELDEAVYDILGLTKEERRQVEEGLKDLQELGELEQISIKRFVKLRFIDIHKLRA